MSRNMTLDPSSANFKKVQNTFQNVRYLLIDEVFTLNCEQLSKVNIRLQQAKQSSGIFGGISVITCGDNNQFEPVQGSTLGRDYGMGETIQSTLAVLFFCKYLSGVFF